jgi:hypothetical protein
MLNYIATEEAAWPRGYHVERVREAIRQAGPVQTRDQEIQQNF